MSNAVLMKPRFAAVWTLNHHGQPDCTASYSRVFATRAEAEETLAALTEKARVAGVPNLPNYANLYRGTEGVRCLILILLPAKQKR